MSITSSVFVGASLDGFIARADGSIDWLLEANKLMSAGEDCGFAEFMNSVDVLVMGRHTFEQVLGFDTWLYGDKPVVVLSSRPISLPAGTPATVSTSSETPRQLVDRLGAAGAQHLYIDGGVTIQRFLTDGLIDEITITVIPILLGTGGNDGLRLRVCATEVSRHARGVPPGQTNRSAGSQALRIVQTENIPQRHRQFVARMALTTCSRVATVTS